MNNAYNNQMAEHDIKLNSVQTLKDNNLKQLAKLSNNQSSSKNIKKSDNKVNEKINEQKQSKLLRKDSKSIIDKNLFNYNNKSELDIDKKSLKQDFSSN